MHKYIIGIDGMMCGGCEAHVQDKLRRSFSLKKVKASHIKNNAVIISEETISEEQFKEALKDTGYKVTSYQSLEAKKTLFGYK